MKIKIQVFLLLLNINLFANIIEENYKTKETINFIQDKNTNHQKEILETSKKYFPKEINQNNIELNIEENDPIIIEQIKGLKQEEIKKQDKLNSNNRILLKEKIDYQRNPFVSLTNNQRMEKISNNKFKNFKNENIIELNNNIPLIERYGILNYDLLGIIKTPKKNKALVKELTTKKAFYISENDKIGNNDEFVVKIESEKILIGKENNNKIDVVYEMILQTGNNNERK